ncbi:MAG: hypothetical protein AVDCRST_MAG03-283, partial [uncultured Rubrobacteraceae bacterium]
CTGVASSPSGCAGRRTTRGTARGPPKAASPSV